MGREFSRRDLLKSSAGAALAWATPLRASVNGPRSKNERIRLGIIGVSGRGEAVAAEAARFGDVVAIADVDVHARSKGLLTYPDAATFVDYRKMLDVMHKSLDAVVVSTPDHHHAPASAMAMHYGLHVYCEKPLTRTIWEARQLGRIAREKRVITQMGNQSTASDSVRRTAAFLRGGALGHVKEIHAWTDRAQSWWAQGVARPPDKPSPKNVDWDLWLGPRPARSYGEGYHPFSWRGWWDFGTGALGDIACHCLNLAHMAYDLRNPIAVQAETSGHNRDSYPLWSVVKYEFGPIDGRDALALTWYDGGKKPPSEKVAGERLDGSGLIIICDKGTVYCPNEYGGEARILGVGPVPESIFAKSPGHMAEWAAAIEGKGAAPYSNFTDYAGPLTETVLLGNLAVFASGPRLEWDSKRLKVKGTTEFEPLITPTFRLGWEF